MEGPRHTRTFHSSVTGRYQQEEEIILIGGSSSRTTEWIFVDGSQSFPGPFEIRHEERHCTIQVSSDTIVVTGGSGTWDYVTSYKLATGGNETPLTPMKQGRRNHACGVYQDAGGQQVRRL